MFTKHFNLAAMRTALTNIAEKAGPTHTATNPNGSGGCTYAVVDVDGSLVPVCIIGQFFANLGLLGLLLHEAPEYAGSEPSQFSTCSVDSDVWNALSTVGVTVDEDAQKFARHAQTGQDDGLPWVRAVQYATDYALWEAKKDAEVALGIRSPWEGQHDYPSIQSYYDEAPAE